MNEGMKTGGENHHLPPSPMPGCPYCGLQAVSKGDSFRAYSENKPFIAFTVHRCDLGHAWYEFDHFCPDAVPELNPGQQSTAGN